VKKGVIAPINTELIICALRDNGSYFTKDKKKREKTTKIKVIVVWH